MRPGVPVASEISVGATRMAIPAAREMLYDRVSALAAPGELPGTPPEVPPGEVSA